MFMQTTQRMKELYEQIRKQLFYMIPEKWERIDLYASVIEIVKDDPVGEMFFYYYPKGIIKKNPVNVYQVPAKFNLIPFNPWKGCIFKEPSDEKTINKFAKILTDARYPAPVRKSRGGDIMAACGQLKSKDK